MIREIAAYEIDRQSSPILRAGVPRTVMACAGRSIGSLQSYAFLLFSLSHTHTSPQKKHRYVSDTISAEDMGPSKYSVEQVHKIGLFDIRIFNLDRHAETCS